MWVVSFVNFCPGEKNHLRKSVGNFTTQIKKNLNFQICFQVPVMLIKIDFEGILLYLIWNQKIVQKIHREWHDLDRKSVV